ncbi:JAB domain-containing protein [Sphingomonas sp.]
MRARIEGIADRSIVDAAAAWGLFRPIADAPREIAAFAYLDRSGALLGLRHSRPGTRSAIALPLRAVTIDALALGATAMLLAHNHPGGDPLPSNADIAATRTLNRVVAPLGILLVDHLIVAGRSMTSMRELGLL